MKRKFNEKELGTLVSGTNKSWLTRTISQQKKYGNYDCIGATVEKDEYGISITFNLGESWGVFRKVQYGDKKGTWERDYGNLYKEEQVTKLVNELAERLGFNNGSNLL